MNGLIRNHQPVIGIARKDEKLPHPHSFRLLAEGQVPERIIKDAEAHREEWRKRVERVHGRLPIQLRVDMVWPAFGDQLALVWSATVWEDKNENAIIRLYYTSFGLGPSFVKPAEAISVYTLKGKMLVTRFCAKEGIEVVATPDGGIRGVIGYFCGREELPVFLEKVNHLISIAGEIWDGLPG